MSKISLADSLLVVSLLAATSALACDGIACKDVEFTYKRQCNIVTNKGEKAVHVTWGNKDWTIPPGGSIKVTAGSGNGQSCLQVVTGKISADYPN